MQFKRTAIFFVQIIYYWNAQFLKYANKVLKPEKFFLNFSEVIVSFYKAWDSQLFASSPKFGVVIFFFLAILIYAFSDN